MIYDLRTSDSRIASRTTQPRSHQKQRLFYRVRFGNSALRTSRSVLLYLLSSVLCCYGQLPTNNVAPSGISIIATTNGTLVTPTNLFAANSNLLNASVSVASFTGSLSGDVTGTQSATVVSSVGSAPLPAAQITGSVATNNLPANLASLAQNNGEQLTNVFASNGNLNVTSYGQVATKVPNMIGQMLTVQNGSGPWPTFWANGLSAGNWIGQPEFIGICALGDAFGNMPVTTFGSTHVVTVNGNIANQTNGIGTGTNSQDAMLFQNLSPGQVSGIAFLDNNKARQFELGFVNTNSDTFHGINFFDTSGAPILFATANTWLCGIDGLLTVPGVYTNGGGTYNFVIYGNGATNYGTTSKNTIVTQFDHFGNMFASNNLLLGDATLSSISKGMRYLNVGQNGANQGNHLQLGSGSHLWDIINNLSGDSFDGVVGDLAFIDYNGSAETWTLALRGDASVMVNRNLYASNAATIGGTASSVLLPLVLQANGNTLVLNFTNTVSHVGVFISTNAIVGAPMFQSVNTTTGPTAAQVGANNGIVWCSNGVIYATVSTDGSTKRTTLIAQ